MFFVTKWRACVDHHFVTKIYRMIPNLANQDARIFKQIKPENHVLKMSQGGIKFYFMEHVRAPNLGVNKSNYSKKVIKTIRICDLEHLKPIISEEMHLRVVLLVRDPRGIFNSRKSIFTAMSDKEILKILLLWLIF